MLTNPRQIPETLKKKHCIAAENRKQGHGRLFGSPQIKPVGANDHNIFETFQSSPSNFLSNENPFYTLNILILYLNSISFKKHTFFAVKLDN